MTTVTRTPRRKSHFGLAFAYQSQLLLGIGKNKGYRNDAGFCPGTSGEFRVTTNRISYHKLGSGGPKQAELSWARASNLRLCPS